MPPRTGTCIRHALRSLACLAAAAALAGLSRPAEAIVTRHDREDARYLALGGKYPEVVPVALGQGTLVAPDWIITAAHVVDGGLSPVSGSVTIGGEAYPVERIVLHPSWVGDLGPGRAELDWVDMALVKLARPVAGVRPAALYPGHDEQGRTIVFVGRGRTGDGRAGPVRDDGRLRAAQNTVTRAEGAWLSFTFDAPPAGDDLEGISGPGDSGGPALLAIDGTRFVIGISSRNDHDAAGLPECVYGTTEVYARVSAQYDWLRRTMASKDGPGSLRPLGGHAGWPATPAGRLASAFFHAYNEPGRDALIAFARSSLSNEAAKMLPAPEWAALWSRQADRTGTLAPYRCVELNDYKIVVLAASADRWRSYRFELEGHEPYGLRELEVGRETSAQGVPLPDPARYLSTLHPPEADP